MRYPQEDAIIWQFDTANFRVICHAEAEDMQPDFDDEEANQFAAEGGAHWFCAFVSVWYGSDESRLEYLGHDCLGGCSYRSFKEFITSHRSADAGNRNTLAQKERRRVICHYFPSMIAQAIEAARKAWHARDNVKLRAA